MHIEYLFLISYNLPYHVFLAVINVKVQAELLLIHILCSERKDITVELLEESKDNDTEEVQPQSSKS